MGAEQTVEGIGKMSQAEMDKFENDTAKMAELNKKDDLK